MVTLFSEKVTTIPLTMTRLQDSPHYYPVSYDEDVEAVYEVRPLLNHCCFTTSSGHCASISLFYGRSSVCVWIVCVSELLGRVLCPSTYRVCIQTHVIQKLLQRFLRVLVEHDRILRRFQLPMTQNLTQLLTISYYLLLISITSLLRHICSSNITNQCLKQQDY